MTETNQAAGALDEALRGSVAALRWLLAAAVIGYLFSGFYVVRQDEVAVELRLGAVAGDGPARVNGPGLHAAWPAPLGEVRRVATGSPKVVESGSFWYHLSEAERLSGREAAPRETLRPGVDGYMYFADGALHARWEAAYEVTDAAAYLFACAEPDALLASALAAAAQTEAAGSPLGDVLREPAGLREAVRRRLEARLRGLDLGLRIVEVRLVELKPPRQVQAAFDAAGQAAEESRTLVDAAAAEAARRRQAGDDEAARRIAAARRDASDYLTRLQADAQAFRGALPEYRANPTAHRRRRLLEALRRVLAAAELVVVPRSGGLDLEVNRIVPPAVSPEEPAQ